VKSLAAGETLKIDFTNYKPGSVRKLQAQSSSGNVTHSFTIVRPDNFQPIVLTDSGPVDVEHDGQKIENLRINTSTSHSCAISVRNRKNVVIRNVEISHKNSGICVFGSDNILIQNVKIVSSSSPETGPHCKLGISNCNLNRDGRADSSTRLNMWFNNSHNATVEFAYLEKGSSGIYLYKSDDSKLSDIHCFDARGPYPRGNCVQWDNSNRGILKNFYIKNIKDVSHELDNVNLWKSDNATISHGLVDGNFSVNGVGVIADNSSDNTVISDVDFTRVSVAAVNVYSSTAATVGKNFQVRNVRVRDTSCEARDNLKPSSGGLAFAVHPSAINPSFTNSIYWNHCRQQASWCVSSSCRKASGGIFDIKEKYFELKTPLKLQFDWEVSKPTITSLTVQ
jgi:hypothetical protein